MTDHPNHDRIADQIVTVDLNKAPANDHEERLQYLLRFLLKADWLDED